MEALALSGASPKRTIMIVSGHDEETMSSGAKAAAAHLAAQGIQAEFVLDEGLPVLAEHPLTGKPAGLIAVVEKGYATMAVTARGKAGHSSTPSDDLAVRTLAQAVLRITDHPYPMRLDGPNLDSLKRLAPQADFVSRLAIVNDWLFDKILIGRIAAMPIAAAGLHTTIAPTMLRGSPKDNVLPATATALINFRIGPSDTPDSIMAKTKSLLSDLPVDLAWDGLVTPSTATSSTSTIPYAVLERAVQTRLEATPAPTVMLGATDAAMMSGVAKDVYRILPVKLSFAETAMYHGANEHISLDALARMAGYYSDIITTVAF